MDHLFGVPGDLVLAFLNRVLQSDVQYVGICNELNAAYAADGYARLRGIGAFATTYAVGDLARPQRRGRALRRAAFRSWRAAGRPSTAHFRTRPLLHHTPGDYQVP